MSTATARSVNSSNGPSAGTGGAVPGSWGTVPGRRTAPGVSDRWLAARGQLGSARSALSPPETRSVDLVARVQRAPRVPERVRVLDEDPELAAVVPDDQRELARTRALAPVARTKGGPWSFRPPRLPGSFGLLVLDGLYGARISFGEHAHLELVGAGDLLRPWAGLGEYQSVPAEIGWQTFEPGTVAFLDADFARAVSAWPSSPRRSCTGSWFATAGSTSSSG